MGGPERRKVGRFRSQGLKPARRPSGRTAGRPSARRARHQDIKAVRAQDVKGPELRECATSNDRECQASGRLDVSRAGRRKGGGLGPFDGRNARRRAAWTAGRRGCQGAGRSGLRNATGLGPSDRRRTGAQAAGQGGAVGVTPPCEVSSRYRRTSLETVLGRHRAGTVRFVRGISKSRPGGPRGDWGDQLGTKGHQTGIRFVRGDDSAAGRGLGNPPRDPGGAVGFVREGGGVAGGGPGVDWEPKTKSDPRVLLVP